jgi:hypothetical protein
LIDIICGSKRPYHYKGIGLASPRATLNKFEQMLLEGKRLASLANEGIDPVNNLNKAIVLWQSAKKGFEKGSHNYAACLSNEGGARAQLAELGEKPRKTSNCHCFCLLKHERRD